MHLNGDSGGERTAPPNISYQRLSCPHAVSELSSLSYFSSLFFSSLLSPKPELLGNGRMGWLAQIVYATQPGVHEKKRIYGWRGASDETAMLGHGKMVTRASRSYNIRHIGVAR